MSIKPPFTELEINRAPSGFYEGNSVAIALFSKIIMIALVLWVLVSPDANSTISALNWKLLESFNSFYVIIVGLFFFFLLAIAIIPSTGRRVMGVVGEKPEFSNFSWFSMMFGAGLGVGLMVFATAEPLGLWGSNPEILKGEVVGNTADAIQSSYRYTFIALRVSRLGYLCCDRAVACVLCLYAQYAFDDSLCPDAFVWQLDEWRIGTYC